MSPDTASMEADVLEAIDAIRPALQADGGDIVFKAIDDDGVVHVELVGACGTCPVSTMTLKAGVERIIMDRVPGVTAVESRRLTRRRAPWPTRPGRRCVDAARVAGDRACAIARLISLVETGGADAVAAVGRALPAHRAAPTRSGSPARPAPGSRRSPTALDRPAARATAIEVGVLAIDPTSPFSGGAILGDRVRMQDHATDPGVFIRSMATRGHLGGLALATPQAVRVLDAAGKPWVLVETVGVGQVEVEIAERGRHDRRRREPGLGRRRAGEQGRPARDRRRVRRQQGRPGRRRRDGPRPRADARALGRRGTGRHRSCETVATDGDGIDELVGRDRRAPRVPGARPVGSPSAATPACATRCAPSSLARLARAGRRDVCRAPQFDELVEPGRRARARSVHRGRRAARRLTGP